jgi:hypothetical protein
LGLHLNLFDLNRIPFISGNQDRHHGLPVQLVESPEPLPEYMVSIRAGSMVLRAQRDCLAIRAFLAEASGSHMGSLNEPGRMADDTRLGTDPCQIPEIGVQVWPRNTPLQGCPFHHQASSGSDMKREISSSV